MSGVILKITNGPTFRLTAQDGTTIRRVLSPGPAIRLTKRVPIGNQGIPGPNEVTSATDTSLTGVLVGNGLKVGVLGYTPENVASKSTDGTLSANSDISYPSQQAVKTYVDTKVADANLNAIVMALIFG